MGMSPRKRGMEPRKIQVWYFLGGAFDGINWIWIEINNHRKNREHRKYDWNILGIKEGRPFEILWDLKGYIVILPTKVCSSPFWWCSWEIKHLFSWIPGTTKVQDIFHHISNSAVILGGAIGVNGYHGNDLISWDITLTKTSISRLSMGYISTYQVELHPQVPYLDSNNPQQILNNCDSPQSCQITRYLLEFA